MRHPLPEEKAEYYIFTFILLGNNELFKFLNSFS